MEQVAQQREQRVAPQREQAERMSWARAMIFAVGFFFLAAILLGQLPGYIYLQMTASTLIGLEQASLALAALCLGGFIVIQVVVMLFDPKPVVPPIVFMVLGGPIAVGGLALTLWAAWTNNQYFPQTGTSWNPVLGGKVLWFPAQVVDFVMLGSVILGVGVAMVFYGQLARREARNPADRSDRGTTPAIRAMLAIAVVLLGLFLVFYTFIDDQGLAYKINPSDPHTTQLIIDSIINAFLAIAIFCTLGAFALRLHYLMRPVRKRTMSRLYLVGIFIAQFGAAFLLVWFVVYPAIAWIHSWSLIGLGNYLTICARKTAIPQSCAFSQQAGYIIDTVVTTNFFVLMMAAIWAWNKKRNLVIIGSVTVTAVLALATLLTHMHPEELLIALLLCGGALVLATVWTNVARREFAIVGEKNLGCVGMWLVVGTCLFIYLAAFAFFSLPSAASGNIPGFRETETNIPFVPGLAIPIHPGPGQPLISSAIDSVVMLLLLAVLAGIQFYFLVRNRYKV
jgi:hypothetical protein